MDTNKLGRITGIGHRITGSLAWFKQHSVTVQRVITDNGLATKRRRFAAASWRGLQSHRPNRPKTNGKAARFIQSNIREWAYATPFSTSAERHAAIHPWLHNDNTVQPQPVRICRLRSL